MVHMAIGCSVITLHDGNGGLIKLEAGTITVMQCEERKRERGKVGGGVRQLEGWKRVDRVIIYEGCSVFHGWERLDGGSF